MNEFSISVRDCHIGYHNKDEKCSPGSHWDIYKHRDVYKHYGFFHRLMNYMRCIGYSIEKDPVTLERFPRIAYCHWYGRKGDLEFNAEYYPAGFSISFFQNINIENKNGGRYDFDKFDKMPYYIRCEMIRTMRNVRAFFNKFPLKDVTKPHYTDAENKIKWLFVESCHHPQQSMDFDLHDLDGTPGSKYKYNILDRDGKEIRNGDIKYTRDYQGYLVRCRVYHNINNMWACILNHDEWIARACFELFDLKDSDVRGRSRPKAPPKEYQQKMKLLHGMKTSELEKELHRRRREARELH